MRYKNLFFDLDDTLWAFTDNSMETFREMFDKYHFERYFDSFGHFYSLYEKKNLELWEKYARNEITRDELNHCRYAHPLREVGVEDEELFTAYRNNYFEIIHTKPKLMGNAVEVLEYLYPKYNLYIISNGFRELQSRKMESAGIDRYFKRIILSEDIGVMKPYPQIFHFAMSATQSNLNESLMIGDNWHADIMGARDAGMHQMYYNIHGREEQNFRPTYEIRNLIEIKALL